MPCCFSKVVLTYGNNISYFPVEILEIIFNSLGNDYHYIISMVSRKFRDIIESIIHHRAKIGKYEPHYGFKTPLRIISSVSLINWALVNGCCPLDERICTVAARNGHLAVLQWINANLSKLQWDGDQDPPCPWNERTCEDAARNGHLAVLQWARSQGCPWNESTCGNAALNGHLAVLQWARAQDPPCPWNEYTCEFAAKDGHLHILQWLRSQDPPCPWNEYTCEFVAKYGHLHILQWARANGCPE